MNYDKPLISVILPIYNAGLYLKESIDSILNQSYTNFELLLLNDGSTDQSEEICLSYKDHRIRYYYHPNCGLAATLNKGIDLSRGLYIARQDGDDISYTQRFEKQLDFLEKNKHVLLLGTRAKVFSELSPEIKFHNHAVQSSILKFDLLFNNPFVHSSIMFRKKDIDLIGYYNVDNAFFEDYELWSRFSRNGDIANLPDVLVDYRDHNQGLSKSKTYFKEDAVYNQSIKNIELLMDVNKPIYSELAALFHQKSDKYKGASKKELHQGLTELAEKIVTIYPHDKTLILKRLKQYEKIVSYWLNMNKRKENSNNPFKLFFLKIENKLKGLHSNVINDN